MRERALDEIAWIADRAWSRRPNWGEAALQLYMALNATGGAVHHWHRLAQALWAPHKIGRGL